MPSRRARRTVIAGAAVSSSRSKNAAQAAPVAATAAPATAPQAGLSSDTTKQLNDLKGLLDNGVLTQQEFDTKKKQILDL